MFQAQMERRLILDLFNEIMIIEKFNKRSAKTDLFFVVHLKNGLEQKLILIHFSTLDGFLILILTINTWESKEDKDGILQDEELGKKMIEMR